MVLQIYFHITDTPSLTPRIHTLYKLNSITSPLIRACDICREDLKEGDKSKDRAGETGVGRGSSSSSFLIRILSSVFPTEQGLDMSGFINCSRKYY